MSNFKLPHWVAIVAALAIVIVSWLMNQAANGALVLPAAVLTALTVGKTLLQLFTDNVSGGAGGGGTVVSAKVAPMPGANGPVPPAAARETLRFPVRRSGTFRVLAMAGAVAMASCTNGVPNPQTVTDVTIGLNGAICVLTTWATDIGAGKSEPDAIADAAIKCGVSVIQATGVLDAHKKAMVLEGYALKPSDAGAAK